MLDNTTIIQTLHIVHEMETCPDPKPVELAIMLRAFMGGSVEPNDYGHREDLTEVLSVLSRVYDIHVAQGSPKFMLDDYAEAIGFLPVSLKKLRELDDDALGTVMVELAEYQRTRYDDPNDDTHTYAYLQNYPGVLSYNVVKP